MRQLTIAILALALLIMPVQASLDKGLLVYFDFDKADGKTLKNRIFKGNRQTAGP